MDRHHPIGAAVALLAAAGGAAASMIDPDQQPGLYALTPEQLTAWTKAVCNNLFTIVNTLVGCYHLLVMGHSTMKKRRAGRARPHPRTPPDGQAPHTDPSGGASSP